MAGRSPIAADEEQRQWLMALSHSRDRGEADRARAILLPLSGWTSRWIAEAFGVREDTVRFWRSAFMRGGVEALKTSVAPGPKPVKAERALAVAEEVLSGPVADRPNWTLPRLHDNRMIPRVHVVHEADNYVSSNASIWECDCSPDGALNNTL